MGGPAAVRVSVEEYLEFENASETKHEFYDGYIVAMAGASFAHILINRNFQFELESRLRKIENGCQTLGSDMRLWVDQAHSFFYPDLQVVCGPPEFTGQNPEALKNPTLIIEILSPSTRRHDTSYKFSKYEWIPSVKEIIFIDSQSVEIQSFTRNGEFWKIKSLFDSKDVLHISSLGLEIPLKNLYGTLLTDTFPDGIPTVGPKV